MKVIALLPIRNEEWVLRHSLACLAGFCDVIIVSDQQSEDRSREICAEFPMVQVIESPASFIAEQARWRLWDVARDYDGHNMIWCTDADEVMSAAPARQFFDAAREGLRPGTVIDCPFHHLWGAPDRYRVAGLPWVSYLKPIAVLDDRQMDYDRSRALPLHEERVPIIPNASRVVAEQVHVLHLQWLLATRNPIKQCWYRCRELLGGRQPVDINRQYAHTLPPTALQTAQVPDAWLDGVTFPDLSIDDIPSWQEREIFGWFAEYGVGYFEPLEIWHIPRLRAAFVARTGREPRPDRSYLPPWPQRAVRTTRTWLGVAKRRLLR